MSSKKSYFQDRIQNFNEKSDYHNQRYKGYSLLRGIAFLFSLFFLVLYIRNDAPWAIVFSGVGTVIFIGFIQRYQYHLRERDYFSQLVQLNQEELDRINLQLDSIETGENFIEPNHPYQSDLDIFGKHSIYQLLNRCCLEDSKIRMASWLSKSSDSEEVSLRQQAIKELVDLNDWSQHFLVTLRRSTAKRQKEHPVLKAADLFEWLRIPTKIHLKYNQAITVLLLLVEFTIAAMIFGTHLPYQWLYLSLLSNVLFVAVVLRKLRTQLKGIDKAHYLVSSYAQSIELLTKQPLRSAKMTELQDALKEGGAVKALKKLSTITNRIDARTNMLYAILNSLFLLDVFIMVAIANWKRRYEYHIEKWLDAIHTSECLVSIGCFAHANEHQTYPEVTEKPFVVKVTEIGHPLIPAEQRVSNDYSIQDSGSIDVLTGSNMSGKSTFQRTLGVNLVLSYLGAPICAKSAEFSVMDLFTSMRNMDNLESQTSSFYAELKRIKMLIEYLNKGNPTFCLLDEVLKGTNSKDRHQGSIALINKLTGLSAIGLVSTHDLSLGELATKNKKVRNYSFNSRIEGSEIIFDYRLKKGICESFNASQLMQNMGLI